MTNIKTKFDYKSNLIKFIFEFKELKYYLSYLKSSILKWFFRCNFFAFSNKKNPQYFFNFIKKSNLITFLASLVIFTSSIAFESNAGNYNISSDTSISSLITNPIPPDNVMFLSNVNLNIDQAFTLNSITASGTNSGILNVGSVSNPFSLTVTNGIGTSGATLNKINLNSDSTLSVFGDLYVGALGMTTPVNNKGNLILGDTSATQNISGSIGSSIATLNTITINQSNPSSTTTTNFLGNVFADKLIVGGNTNLDGNLTIGGTGNLNFAGTSATFNLNTTIASTGTNNFGATTVSDKQLTLNSNATLSDLNTNTSGSVLIANNKTMTVSGSIIGTGTIDSSVGGLGNISFNGTAAQNVASKIGYITRIGNVSVSNTSADITFSDNANITTLDLASSSTVSIATSKTLDISGNVTGSITDSSITGDGIVLLSGSSQQTVGASLGSTTNNLEELRISNSAGVVLNGDSYINNLNPTSNTTITTNNILESDNFTFNNNITLDGTGTNYFKTVNIGNGGNLILNSDALIDNVVVGGATANILVAANKDLYFSSDLKTGGGPPYNPPYTPTNNPNILNLKIDGLSNGVGNVNFFIAPTAGNFTTINTAIGSNNRLGKISVNNNNKILQITKNTNTVDLQIYDNSAVFLSQTGLLNVTGNIYKSNSNVTGEISPSIIGRYATISLVGSSIQTVDMNLGLATSDNRFTFTGNDPDKRIGELIINNPSGVILNGNNFITTLTLTSNLLTLGSNTLTDVSNAIDLSGKNITLMVGDSSTNPFGAIKSGGTITVNPSTSVNFDYSSNNSVIKPGDFLIAQSAGINGNVDQITVTDNSLLFNNKLSLSGNDIYANLSVDIANLTNNLTSLGISSQNDLDLILNAINYTDINYGFVSISDSQQLKEAIQTMKPMNNSSQVNSVLYTNNNIIKIVGSHGQENDTKSLGLSDNLWARTFGSISNQKERSSTFGYKENSGGFLIGADKVFLSNIALGVAFGYSRSAIKGDAKYNNQISINNYHTVLYKTISSKNGLGLYNDNAIAFNLSKYKTERRIKVGTFESTARGDFYGTSGTARIGLGYKSKISENVFIDPNFAIEYFRINKMKYKETSSGNAGLNVKNKTLSGYFSDVNLSLGTKIRSTDYSFIPKFNVGWKHAMNNYSQKSNISFIGGGSSIENNSIPIQRNILNLGLGINIYDKDANFLKAMGIFSEDDDEDDDSNKNQTEYSNIFQIKCDLNLANKYSNGIISAKYIFLF